MVLPASRNDHLCCCADLDRVMQAGVGLASHIPVMDLHLTDEQGDLLVRELDRIIADDRYFLSPRIRALREIRALLKIPWGVDSDRV